MAFDEDRIALLLRTLPPPPPGWVPAAVELPLARRALADVEPLLADNERRQAQTAELEQALQEAGYEPTPALVRALRRELGRPLSPPEA
jgi:hypothetical protein